MKSTQAPVSVAGTNLTDEYHSPAFFYTASEQLCDGSVGRPRLLHKRA
jgi:hypothetical protein